MIGLRKDPFEGNTHNLQSTHENLLHCSGGFKMTVLGENLDTVQNPMMKFFLNTSDYEFVSVSEMIIRTEDLILGLFSRVNQSTVHE